MSTSVWSLDFALEALYVGIATVVVGLVISYVAMGKAAEDFKHWRTLALTYFLTGAVLHILFQVTGLNKQYCTKGVACRSEGSVNADVGKVTSAAKNASSAIRNAASNAL